MFDFVCFCECGDFFFIVFDEDWVGYELVVVFECYVVLIVNCDN